jgi:hypothetical protein
MRPSVTPSPECFALPGALGGSEQGLSALFTSSVVGFVVCDRELRFRAVNDGLAKINRVRPEAHLGKTICGLLGNSAHPLESPLIEVFGSGKVIINWDVEAELSTRPEAGRWIETYFPLRDAAARVDGVGAILVEVPLGSDQASLSVQRRIASLRQCHQILGMNLARLSRNPVESGELTTVLARSIELLESCTHRTQAVSKPRYEILTVSPKDQRCRRIVRTDTLRRIQERLARISSNHRCECFVRDITTGAIVARTTGFLS